MESLSDIKWDLVISGTGLAQSLLALSLSRSGRKVLHLDRNQYYGGFEAALSLEEAEKWKEQVNDDADAPFSHVQITVPTDTPSLKSNSQLSSSRSYSLSLSPQLLYAQSTLLPALVTSKVHEQLEFLAVGSWWICKDGSSMKQSTSDIEHAGSSRQPGISTMQKIPSGREDVFSDSTISMRDKRALMKFLRHVIDVETDTKESPPQNFGANSLADVLSSQFNISPTLRLPILALSLSQDAIDSTNAQYAITRIRRHLRSIGMFGPGFGSMIIKYGGAAEVAQVGCRAGAVGGGVYVLGRGIDEIKPVPVAGVEVPSGVPSGIELSIKLSDGEAITSRWFVGDQSDLPPPLREQASFNLTSTSARVARSINIVSSPLTNLFPPTADNGPIPACAVVVFGGEELRKKNNSVELDKSHSEEPPIYLLVHSSDSGECLAGQCVIYASTKETSEGSRLNLTDAVERLLSTANEDPAPRILWSMSYNEKGRAPSTTVPAAFAHDESGQIMAFPHKSLDLAFDDALVDNVKGIWKKIMGSNADDVEFLRFEEHENIGDDGVDDE